MKKILVLNILFIAISCSAFTQAELPAPTKIKYDVPVYKEDGSKYSFKLKKGHYVTVIAIGENKLTIEFEKEAVKHQATVTKYAIPTHIWKEGATEETKKEFQYSKVAIGMNMHKVAELLGRPTRSDSANVGGDVIITRYYERGGRTYIITFYNGKVYSKQVV